MGQLDSGRSSRQWPWPPRCRSAWPGSLGVQPDGPTPPLGLSHNASSSHPERGTVLLKSSSLPCSVQALLGCAVALVVGVAVMNNYGVDIDAHYQRSLTFQKLYFMLAPETHSPPEGSDRFYGVAFEIPMLLVEYAVGPDHRDTRPYGFISPGQILSRHLLTHLFFLAGDALVLFGWRPVLFAADLPPVQQSSAGVHGPATVFAASAAIRQFVHQQQRPVLSQHVHDLPPLDPQGVHKRHLGSVPNSRRRRRRSG